ncbi:11219_t:CDS:2 [Ambispora gerdemannii]|uniref:11219_t:CDS:1 n=1 Tax=Ambispora gerdemannii TaxID=144530 RepID=A0A9N8YX54_9GLOM|nr:11219_t:CDS:2 [Ambispora gerdemannii]
MTVKKFAIFFLVCLIFATLRIQYSSAAKPLLLDRKLRKLNEQVQKHDGVVELDSDLFDEFLAKPRNYSFVVLLTALDSSINCHPCKEFDPEFRLVARSWEKIGTPSRLFFGILDYQNGREIFNKLKQNTAPSLWYYPAIEGPFAKDVSEPDKYDFSNRGFGAEEFASYLTNHLGVQVPLKRPPNYFLIVLSVFFLIGALAAIKLLFPLVRGVFESKNTWAAISLVIILMMISGHMWNHIRTPPYVTTNGGNINYIAGGFQNQYGLESQIVAILYGLCAFAVVSLTVTIPKLEDKMKQRFGWES